MDEAEENYDKWNKPDREVQILHDITFIRIKLKSQTHRNRQNVGCQGLKLGGVNKKKVKGIKVTNFQL